MTTTDTTLAASGSDKSPPAVENVDDELIDDEAEVEDAELAAPAATLALEPTPVVLPSPEPIVITGLFAGLSLIAQVNEAPLLLAIARMNDGELRVSVQPPTKKDEPNGSALPLIVCGTPDELDRHFLEALGSYVPARNYAVASVDAIAQSIKTAADAARTKTAKKPTPPASSRPSITQESTKGTTGGAAPAVVPAAAPPPVPVVKKGFGLVTIVATPADATIRVQDAKGKTHTPESGHELTCADGRGTVTVTHPNYRTKLQAVDVSAAPQTITVELPAPPGLFTPPAETAEPTAAPSLVEAGAGAETDSGVKETPVRRRRGVGGG